MPRAVPIVRGVYQVTGLFFVLVSIPLAFDVGGTDCGIAFTFLLSLFYFTLCSLRLLFNRTPLRSLASLFYDSQFIIIPSMLLLHLSRCSLPQSNLGVLSKLSWPWRTGLDYATGPFSILEGFCALIVIQACGRAATSVARKSDVLLLVQLFVASVMISADIYLLVRIYLIPDIVGVTTATLIGAALTICLSLGTYGIWSRRGSVIESTLLFSYVVYQIYLTFTDFQAENRLVVGGKAILSGSGAGTIGQRIMWDPLGFVKSALLSVIGNNGRLGPDSNPVLLSEGGDLWPKHLLQAQLPPVIIDSCTEFMTTVAELTTTGIKTMFDFLRAALISVTPSICISLVVRLSAYFVAMRLVPYIKHDPQHLRRYNDAQESKKLSRWVLLAYSYSPILIIMVYTHLLLQHGGQIVHAPRDAPSVLPFELSKIWTNSRQAWQFWGWANVFTLLGLYGIELAITPADNATTPTGDDTLEINI